MALDYVEDEEILVEQLKETASNRSSSSAAGIDWKVILVYVQCYFVSIATILGTGILGLPVTLAHAGFYPFLLSFLTGFLMQVLLIYLFVELLQKAYAVLNADSEGCSEVPSETRKSQSDGATAGAVDAAQENKAGRGRLSAVSPARVAAAAAAAHAPTPAVQSHTSGIMVEDMSPENGNQVSKLSLEFASILKADNIESVPLHPLRGELGSDDELEDLQNGEILAGHVILPRHGASVKHPNLHSIAALFLGCCLTQAFDVIILIQFVSLLTSYALAGSEAYAAVIGIEHFYVIPVFVWCLTACVVFAHQIIQPVVSVLTLAKGGVLIVTVVVTFSVGLEIKQTVQDNYHYMGEPILMGTVALGGIINVMPMLYTKVAPVPAQVRRFRGSIIAGLTTCMVLNVLWCWAVLNIVPQLSECQLAPSFTQQPGAATTWPPGAATTWDAGAATTRGAMDESNDTAMLTGSIAPAEVCMNEVSLQASHEAGEISTIPLSQIILEKYPEYDWVAILVQVFIMISITVSYLTIGAALHHTVTGWLDAVWIQDVKQRITSYSSELMTSQRCCSCCNKKWCCGVLLSVLAFAVVFMIAMVDPQGFVKILDEGTSFFLNIECGFFIFLMLLNSRRGKYSDVGIPVPSVRIFYYGHFLLLVYFSFAVVFDVVQMTYKFTTKNDLVF